MTSLPTHRRYTEDRMKIAAVVMAALMTLGPFISIASTSNWFLHPPSSVPVAAPQLRSGEGYLKRNVLVAKLVPEDSRSGSTLSSGAVSQSGLSFMSRAVSALEGVGGTLRGVFADVAGLFRGIVSGATVHQHSNASPSNPSSDSATTLSRSSSSEGIPPNDTAGYVENTLLLNNNTLLLGNALGPFGGTVTPTSIAVNPSNGMIFVAAVVDGSNTTVFEVNPSTDRVVKSVTVLPPAGTQCGLYAPASTFDAKNGYLYITSSSCPAPVVAVFDTVNGTMLEQVQLPAGFGANAIAYDPSSNEIYVTGQYGASESVEIINATTDSLTAPMSLGGCWTFAPLFDSYTGLMYVTVWYCGSDVALRHEDIYAINSTNAVVAKIPIPDDDVAVVGADTAGITPNGTIYEEDGSSGYGRISYPVVVVNPQANTSSVIDIPCGLSGEWNTCYPVGVTYDKSNGYVYFASSLGSPFVSWNVTTFNPVSGAVVGSVTLGFEGGTTSFALSSGGLQGLSFDPVNGQLYGPNPGSGTVSVISDKRFNVTFAESGLPTGDRWGMVSAGTPPKFTTSTTITYSAPNGVYDFNVTAGDGYCVSVPSERIVVNGSDTSQTIDFTNSGCHTVTFEESGLPNGEAWSATLSGFTSSATAPSTVSFTEPDGNYTYTVPDVGSFGYLGVIEYCQLPYRGDVELQGANVSAPVQYSICGGAGSWTVKVHTNSVFYSGTEKVLVDGNVTTNPHVNYTTYATVTLTNPLGAVIRSDTVAVNATTGLFHDNFTTGGPGWIGGTYTVIVYWPTGPGCTSPSLECSFSQWTYQFGYLPSGPTYQVTFVEGGLPKGTPWTMTFANVTKTSTSNTISYSFPDGYYPYTVGDAGPYVPQLPPRTQMVLVNGSGVTVDVGFAYSEQLLLYNGTTYPGPILTSYAAYNRQIRQLAYDSVDGLLYVLSANSPDTILGVNVTTKHVTQEFTVTGSGIDTLTVDPSSGDLFVTNTSFYPTYPFDITVTIINPVNAAVVAVVPLPHPSGSEYGAGIQSASFASSTNAFYALENINNDSTGSSVKQVVYEISGTTGAIESEFTVSASGNLSYRSFSSMSVDPVHGTLYLAGRFENSTFSGSSVLILKPSPWAIVWNVTLSLPNLNSISYDTRNGLAYLAFGDYSYGCSGGGLYSFNANTSISAKVGSMACAAAATFDPANGDLYVSNPVFQSLYENAYGLSVVDPATGAVVANITKLAEQEFSADTVTSVNAADGEVYVASPNSYAILVVDSSNTVASEILLGATPGTMVYSSDGMVFVADQQTGTLWVLNATTGQVEGSVPVPAVSIGGMVYDPTNRYLYVVDSQSSVASVRCTPFPGGSGYTCNSLTYDNVTVFNTRTGAVVTTIPINTTTGSPFEGVNLVSAAYDPVSDRIFVTGTNANKGYLFVIEASTNSLVGNISLGAQPSATGAVTYDPVTGYIYALGGREFGYASCSYYFCQAEGSDRLYAINGSTDTIVTNSSVPLSDAMAVDSKTGTIYTVGDGLPFELAVINATTGNVITVASLPCSQSSEFVCGTTAVAYDSGNGVIYVAVSTGGSPILAFYNTVTGATGDIYDGISFHYVLPDAGQQILIYDPSANELLTSAGYSLYYSEIGAISIIRPLNASFVPVTSSSLQVSTVLPDGRPVSGVLVSVAGLEFSTGTSGTLTFTGLPAGESESVQACIAGLCATKTVTLGPGSNTISFEVQPVHAAVVNQQNQPVGGVQLTYSGTGGVAGLFTTNSSGLAPSILSPSGATFTVSTNLYGTGLPYETPPPESFIVNGTAAVIRLHPLPAGTLQGVVVYSNSVYNNSNVGLVANARVTLSEQVNGLTLTDTASTNSTGGYSITFYAGEVTVYALSPLFYTSSLQSATIQPNGTTTLNLSIPLTGPGYINLQLYTQYLGGALQGPLPVDWRVGAHYDIYAQDPQGNQYRVPDVYLPSGQLVENVIPVTGYSGERFTVCVDGYEANLPSECVPVTLDIYRNATAVIKLIQPGVLSGAVVDAATGSPVSSWSADVYYVNATGYASFVTSISNYTSSLYYGVPQLGEYRLDVFSQVGSDELWGQVTVNASASQVYQLGNISLYMGAGDFFTGKAGNTLSVIPGESAPGGTLFLRATYNYTGSFALDNVSILLPVPAGTTAVAGGFLLDGKPVNASSSTPGYYSVPLGSISPRASGEVRYELQIGDGYSGSSLALLALVSYTVGGKTYVEALATTVETVEQATLSAPLSLSTLNTTVSGQAPPGSALDLYANDTPIGTTVVPPGGYWVLNVTLPSAGNQTTYQLHAVSLTTSGVHLYSPSVSVVYDNTEPQLVKICMQQTDGRLMCWDPQEGIPHFPYVFVPGMPMTFTLTFSRPSLVGNVSVFVPGVGTVYATLNQNGLFEATTVPHAFGDVYVSYNVLRVPKGNGVTLPIPTGQQVFDSLPPGLLGHANYTILSHTNTSFTALIGIPKNMSWVLNATALEVSVHLTPDVFYTLTSSDVRNLSETGYPLYNITTGSFSTANGTEYKRSFFIPYSALPPNYVKALDNPLSSCSKCPTEGGVGITITTGTLKAAAPSLLEDTTAVGRVIPFLGAGLAAYGWFEDHQFISMEDIKLQQLQSCISSAPSSLANEPVLGTSNPSTGQPLTLSQYFSNKESTYHRRLYQVGRIAEINDIAGGLLSFTSVTGVTLTASAYSSGVSITAMIAENQLAAQINSAISNCEKYMHSMPPGSDTANVNPIEDPSGVVYAGLLTNPVANATVTVFQFNSTMGQWIPWTASGYGQLNPQHTDPEGRYAWFVPAGKYMVVVQAPGFSTARSIVVYVPPPATGVDINLLPLSPPEVSGVSAFSNSTGSYIEFSFDQLMETSSLNSSTVTVIAPGGQTISGRVVPVAPQTAPDGESLMSEVVFIPNSPLTAGVNYTVAVSSAVSNYANMTMSSTYTASVSLAAINYSLNTSSPDVGVGEPVTAVASTNNPLAKYVRFTWVSPTGEPVFSTTVALASMSGSASITPNSNGTWVVEASFTDGMNAIQTISRTFYVVEPAPLTEVFATVTANTSGSASVDYALINGVSVIVTGVAPGTSLFVDSFDYEVTPPGTPSLTGTATYFDLEVLGASTGTSTVCFSGAAVNSTYLLYYYNPYMGQWLQASGRAFSQPDTVCGTVAVSELSGTPMAAVLPPATPPPPRPSFSFSVGVAPTTVSIQQGGTATATVSVSLVSGSTQPVTLSTSGLPQGTSASFSQDSCTPGCSSTLTIEASASAPPGSYTVTVSGRSEGESETAVLTLVVTPLTSTTSTTTSTANSTSSTTSTTTSTTSTTSKTPSSSTTYTTTSQTHLPSTSSTTTTSTVSSPPPSYTVAVVAVIVIVLVVSAVLLTTRRRGSSPHPM